MDDRVLQGGSGDGPDDPGQAPTQELKSKYEFVMAASKEAERLNDRYRKTGVTPLTKVTVEAVRRVRRGISRVVYEEPQGPPDEVPKESTYFFGS